jgi:hypothetical protein
VAMRASREGDRAQAPGAKSHRTPPSVRARSSQDPATARREQVGAPPTRRRGSMPTAPLVVGR